MLPVTGKNPLGTAICAVVAMMLAACGTNSQSDSAPAPLAAATATPDTATPAPPDEAVLEMTSSCENEFPLVIEPSTYSLVATGNVSNSGTAAGEVDVSAQWFPVGLEAYTATKTVTVGPGEEVRVPFSEKVPTKVMNGMVGLQHGDQMCDVNITPK